jgi:type IV pilus assembly protein PilC
VFGRLAETLAFRLKLKKEFRSNMAYPLVVFFLGAIIFSLLLFFVVPHFEHFLIHQISDEPVSMATQCVFKLSAFFRHYGVFLWGLFLAGILWPKSSRFWNRFGALPLLNRFTNALCLGQISGHVATMLKNGVPLLDALMVGSHLSCRYEESIRTVVRRLSNGQPLSFALEGNILFPHLMIEMVRLGEENGRMDEAFSKVSSHYLLEYQRIMFLIVRWSEPTLIIFLAFLLGFLFFSIFSPILHCLVRM